MEQIPESLPAVEVEITLRQGRNTRKYTGIQCEHIEFETEMEDSMYIDDAQYMYGGARPVKFLLHMPWPRPNSNGILYTITDDPPQEKHGL